MFNPFNIGVALKSLKKIYENNQCAVCDKTEKLFLRFSCGHSVCENCAAVTGNCFFCLTPSEQSTSKNPAFDDVLTERATNASALLKTFEKAFNVDVHKYQRISEKLKLEKEIFPECIQAPLKYCNKRKSLNPYIRKKCNLLSKFPGEIISTPVTTKMENSINSVEKWIDKNIENSIINQKVSNNNKNDDSGIVTDGSIIDCSQITEDKDRNALLAIYEADFNEPSFDSVYTIESEIYSGSQEKELSSEHPKILKDDYKVPFFKKSKLAQTCDNHSNIFTISTNESKKNKNIQISIFNYNQSMKYNKGVQKKKAARSILIQTDISEISQLKENTHYLNNRKVLSKNKYVHVNVEVCSQEVFTSEEIQIYKNADGNISNKDTKLVTNPIVIEETDSENSSTTVQDHHRFQDPAICGVLRSFDSNEEFRKGPKRRLRGLTPDSSNSSEKENMDPRKPKRARHEKKKKKK